MNHYPIILIPEQIQGVKSKLPPKPSLPEFSKPQHPGEKPKKINNATLVGVGVATVTTSSIAMVSQGATVPGLLLFLAGVGAIAAHVWLQIRTYPKREQKHRRALAIYHEEMEENARKKFRYHRELREYQSPEEVAQFQYMGRLNILKETVSFDYVGSQDWKRGNLELRFEKVLKKYFPHKIQINLKVQNPKYDKYCPYTPDFAYIDERLNLHIDIEIDEPYAYKNNKPIHYVGKDKERNEFFNDRGWIVIRFSEEQVIRHHDSCCKTIAQVITEITGDNLILHRFNNTPDLQLQPRWTKIEAINMAKKKTRNRLILKR